MIMKKLLTSLVVAASLMLAGCAGGVSVFQGGTSLTATITNPVGQVDIYRVKNVYAASLALAADYRDYCWSKPYAAILADPVSKAACQNRRAIVRTLQTADLKAFAAITAADNFTKNNPTISAASAVGAAWTAVSDFQSLAASVAVVR